MYEPTVTRAFGSDVARSGWQPAADRADAPRPDAVRSEAAQAERPSPVPTTGKSDAPVEVEIGSGLPGDRDPARESAFPTSYARFSINSETKKLSIKIVDAVTEEVIREIPAEQVQRIAADLRSLARRNADAQSPSGGTRAPGEGVDRYV